MGKGALENTLHFDDIILMKAVDMILYDHLFTTYTSLSHYEWVEPVNEYKTWRPVRLSTDLYRNLHSLISRTRVLPHKSRMVLTDKHSL